MKSCHFACEYSPYDSQGERYDYIHNKITCEIFENGLPISYLVCDFLTYFSGGIQSVTSFICSNPNYTQSDFLDDLSNYNLYTLVNGGGISATVVIVNHLLEVQIAQPVYNFEGMTYSIPKNGGFVYNHNGIYGYNVQSGLYSELIENNNSFQALNAIYQTNPPTYLTDDDFKSIVAIEAYNKNYFLNLISQNSSNNHSPGSSGSSNVDLTTINTQLTNIANNLKTTVYDEQSGEDIEVSVTDIIKDKEDTNLIEIQEVETKNKELVPFLNNEEWSF